MKYYSVIVTPDAESDLNEQDEVYVQNVIYQKRDIPNVLSGE